MEQGDKLYMKYPQFLGKGKGNVINNA